MRKILFIALSVLSSSLFAVEKTNMLTLHIQFDSKPTKVFYELPLHLNKTIKIDAANQAASIVTTETLMRNNQPFTAAILVQPTEVNKDQVGLKFNLVSYGFGKNDGSSVLSQPAFVLKYGQLGEVRTDTFKLKVMVDRG